MSLSFDVIGCLSGKTIATAESLTGGGIGAALTAVPGSSAVYQGGVISYTNDVKSAVLGVSAATLKAYGAVSEQTAGEMATGVRRLLKTDIAVSVTGLAGPGGDEFDHPIGTVYICYEDSCRSIVRCYRFEGDRETVRAKTVEAALQLILEFN